MRKKPVQLDQKILARLGEGPISRSALAQELGVDRDVVDQHCRRLAAGGDLERIGPSDLDRGILSALNGNGPVSTAELAKVTKADRNAIYRRCKQLEARFGFLESAAGLSEQRLFFFPATGHVLNRSNYRDIDDVIGRLKGIVRKHPIKNGTQLPPAVKDALRKDFTKYLHELAAECPPRSRMQIEGFERELMTVLRGTTKSDVVGLFGLRPFRPKIRKWIICVSLTNAGLLPGDVIYVAS